MIVGRDITSNIIIKQRIIGGLFGFVSVLSFSDPIFEPAPISLSALALYCLVMRLPFINFPGLLKSHLVLSWPHRTVC